MKFSIVFLLLLPLMLNGQVSNKNKGDFVVMKVVDFCDIAKRPEKYVDRKVKFIANLAEGLMQPKLLSDSKCKEHVLMVSFIEVEDSTSHSVKEYIEKNLKESNENSSSGAKFMFTGYLRKDPNSNHVSIKGLLQGHTMIISSARSR